MVGLVFADYMNAGMEKRGWKIKDLERESHVADSTLLAYKKGRSNNPSRDNMYRIAAAFGDPPSVIDAMFTPTSGEQDEEERRLLAEAADAERIARIVAMIRENMIEIMVEHREQSSAQQSEIFAHAQAKIAEAEQDFKRRNAEVLRQCREEIDREKAHCQQRIDDMQKYASSIHAEEKDHMQEMRARNTRSVDFLKSCIFNISFCAMLLGFISFLSTGYSIFAFFAFDLSDPSRGLYQGNAFFALLVIITICALLLLIIWRVYILVVRRDKNVAEQFAKNRESE